MNLYDQTEYDTEYIQKTIHDYYPYAKDYLKFDLDADIYLVSDKNNASDFLGKTAYYAPSDFSVYLYIDDRHPKDILRSLSHELIHHHQNCRGEFQNSSNLGEEGYAQSDAHLRNMEKEAYLVGNLAFRDWCDGLKREEKTMLMEGEKMSKRKKQVLDSKSVNKTKKEAQKPLKTWYSDNLYDELVRKWAKPKN